MDSAELKKLFSKASSNETIKEYRNFLAIKNISEVLRGSGLLDADARPEDIKELSLHVLGIIEAERGYGESTYSSATASLIEVATWLLSEGKA
jgi:hypothetical protein